MPSPITPALLQGAFQNFNMRFEAGRAQVQPWWNKIAMLVPSGTEEEIYEWMQGLPKVREWQGNRKVQRLGTNAYRLRNKKYEQTIAIDRTKFEDDKLGFYGPRFELMGREVSKWPDHNLYPLLKAPGNGWDNASFFGAHIVDPNNPASPTYTNDFALTLDQPGFETVYAAMAAFPAEDGEPMGLVPDTIFVPPALRGTALRVVEAENIAVVFGTNTAAAAVTNVNKGTVKVVVLPELAGQDKTWYLGVTDGPIKPLIYQQRVVGGLVSRVAEESDNVFERDEYEYGARLRGAFGYGLPYLMARSVGP